MLNFLVLHVNHLVNLAGMNLSEIREINQVEYKSHTHCRRQSELEVLFILSKVLLHNRFKDVYVLERVLFCVE